MQEWHRRVHSVVWTSTNVQLATSVCWLHTIVTQSQTVMIGLTRSDVVRTVYAVMRYPYNLGLVA